MTTLKIVAAIIGFLFIMLFGQAIVDAFVPRIVQGAVVFLCALYFVVRQAVQDGHRQ